MIRFAELTLMSMSLFGSYVVGETHEVAVTSNLTMVICLHWYRFDHVTNKGFINNALQEMHVSADICKNKK